MAAHDVILRTGVFLTSGRIASKGSPFYAVGSLPVAPPRAQPASPAAPLAPWLVGAIMIWGLLVDARSPSRYSRAPSPLHPRAPNRNVD